MKCFSERARHRPESVWTMAAQLKSTGGPGLIYCFVAN